MCACVHPGQLFSTGWINPGMTPEGGSQPAVATSGRPSMQKHAAFLPQLDSATQHLLGLDAPTLELCTLAFSTVEETKWAPRGSGNQHRITQCKKEMSLMSLFLLPKFLQNLTLIL